MKPSPTNRALPSVSTCCKLWFTLRGFFLLDLFCLVPLQYLPLLTSSPSPVQSGPIPSPSLLALKSLRFFYLLRKRGALRVVLLYISKYAFNILYSEVLHIIYQFVVCLNIVFSINLLLLLTSRTTPYFHLSSISTSSTTLSSNAPSSPSSLLPDIVSTLFFLVHSLGNVGYGEEYPIETVGYIGTMGVVIGGLLMFGYFVARFRASQEKDSNYSQWLKKRSSLIESWLWKFERHSGPTGTYNLFRSLKEHYLYFYKHDIQDKFSGEYFDVLGPAMQFKVSKDCVDCFVNLFSGFFKNIDQECWIKLFKKLRFRT